MMNSTLHFANPKAQFETHRTEIEAAIQRVCEAGIYVHGPVHEAFEEEFARYIGVSHALGVANGTDALVLALLALDISEGSRVLVPSHTAAPTVSAIRQVGAIPVFLDVDENSYVITPDAVEAALTDDIKAIVAVHLYGCPVDVISLRSIAEGNGIALIEDCAQAAGARIGNKLVGSIGHAGCFSFFPTKNLGAIGDGGMVTVNDATLADRIRRKRLYGWSPERICMENGFNSRLDELQAAILRVKLPRVDEANIRRRDVARLYREGLSDLPVSLPTEGSSYHVYHLFVIAADDRATLLKALERAGIVAGIHYPVPNHLHPAYRRYCVRPLPATERLVERILSLPIYPELAMEDVERVISVIRAHYTS